MTLSLPGILFKGFTSQDMETVNYEQFQFTADQLINNKTYIKVRDSYIEYLDDFEVDFDKKAEEIKRDNTYEKVTQEDILDKKGKKIGTKEVKEMVEPEVIKKISLDKPELRHLLAYISVKHMQEDEGYSYNPKEGKKFLKDITDYHESIVGQDPIYFNAWTTIMNEHQIADKYFPQSLYGEDYKNMQEMYLLSFESMEDFDDALVGSAYEYVDLNTLNIHGNGMEIPHLLQYDPKWGSKPYGVSTIKTSGCAITSMAMVQSYLQNQGILPPGIAQWSSSHGYYITGKGTAWAFFEAYANEIGIKCTDLGKNIQAVIKALENNKPVISSMAPGTFTSYGHFIVLRGITADGKILVNDPNDNYYSKKFYEREFDINLIYSEAKNFWSFE